MKLKCFGKPEPTSLHFYCIVPVAFLNVRAELDAGVTTQSDTMVSTCTECTLDLEMRAPRTRHYPWPDSTPCTCIAYLVFQFTISWALTFSFSTCQHATQSSHSGSRERRTSQIAYQWQKLDHIQGTSLHSGLVVARHLRYSPPSLIRAQHAEVPGQSESPLRQ